MLEIGIDGYRKCPVCREFKIPPNGVKVCCQNPDCTLVIDTQTGEAIGRFIGTREIKYK